MKYLFQLIFLIAALETFSQSKPNIVIFISDDQNQRDVGAYGNKDVNTPNMDMLASEGMKFNKAYAVSSMCAPSRSAVFTGLYPFRNGAQMNHFTVRPNIHNLPELLQKSGYRVVIAGKTDVFPLSSFPFEQIGKEFGQYEPVELRTDKKKETIQFIESHFKNHQEKPLCLIVAPWLPHVPWVRNRDFNPSKLQIPEYLTDTKETREALAAYYQSISEADNMLGEVMNAVDKAGRKENTAFIFFSDQGAQFPGAKWTVYDQGLRVPFIIRWPGKVAKGSVSDALISLVDITPTLIDLAGGQAVEGLDGKSFKNVLTGEKNEHRKYVFAETSLEPHYWYNYVPSRTIIAADGFHYIKNYFPGVQFITHIDKVERNMFYFDSWVEKSKVDEKTRFLLNRYSFRPSEELYNISQDRAEFDNLIYNLKYSDRKDTLRKLLQEELKHQGETEEMILEGPLPQFYDRAYAIKQNKGVADLSFNKKIWNPDTLFVTAYIDGIDEGGIVCDYFNQFKLVAYKDRIGVEFGNGKSFYSGLQKENRGNIVFKLTNKGDIKLYFNGYNIIDKHVSGDFTKIKTGYVSCGKIQGESLKEKYQTYKGVISNMRFTMNELARLPGRLY